ncbi:MAG: transporter substrate-binding domain-containing protein, partial [Eubacterium sp.]|nr:transporter substrate-binding domain-containing protein [Eubacterium sp.]
LFLVTGITAPITVAASVGDTDQAAPGETTEQADEGAAGDKQPEYSTFEELNGKTMAMITGAPFEELISSKVSDVKEFQYFNSSADMTLALRAGKIDAFLMNNAVGDLIQSTEKDICRFPIDLKPAVFGLAYKKGFKDLDMWQQAYDRIPEEDKKAIWDKWSGADESVKTMPEQDWPGNAGTIQVAACDTLPPMSYVGDNGELMGIEIELLMLMAKDLDYHIEFKGMEFSAIMPEVQSGKSDIGTGSIVITDERRELVDFVEEFPAAFVLMVRAKSDQAETTGGFFEEIGASFERTFIKDNRYLMVISGLGITVVIAVISGALGVLIGWLLTILRYKDNRVANRLIAIYGGLVSGLPVVIILMVFYYIVFGAFDIPAAIVSIIGFAIIFGARAYIVMWTGVSAVDSGQREAALALGYTENRAFHRIIFPQARRIYFPVLRSQLVNLLKETSVVGYITVLDLTRAGDLIRSRTLEAFFPLISIAVIYFLLTYILSAILKAVGKKMDKGGRIHVR